MITWSYINVLLAAIGIISWVVWAMRNKNRWLYAIVPLTYLFHVMVFYGSLFFGSLDHMTLNSWSSAIRLHGIIICIFGPLILLTSVKWNHPHTYQ